MAARKLLAEFRDALRAFLELDDDENEIEMWDRTAVFELDEPEEDIWDDLPCAENPPIAYLLMSREVDGLLTHELLWAVDDLPEAKWPVVEVNEDGDTQVLANNADDYVDALLVTGGMLGGGTEDDLEDAREEASAEGSGLAQEMIDELDRTPPDVETLGERWENAEDRWTEAWSDIIEGIADH